MSKCTMLNTAAMVWSGLFSVIPFAFSSGWLAGVMYAHHTRRARVAKAVVAGELADSA